MIVVDASVAVKWFRDEAHSDLAEKLHAERAGEMIAPDLFAIEVTAALVRNANAVKAIRPAMERALSAFEAMIGNAAIILADTTSAGRSNAAKLALDLGHPLKDCLYLQLAMARECPLITGDTRFAAKARGVYAGVEVLGEG